MSLVINVENLPQQRTALRVCGEIDAYTAPTFREQMSEAEAREPAGLIVDLQKVRYLDSTGLGVMMGAAKRARERGCSLVVICTNEHILRILKISGLTELITVVAGQEEALNALEEDRGCEGNE